LLLQDLPFLRALLMPGLAGNPRLLLLVRLGAG
jgi:hypothetical protein